jgi:CAAX prenyl protease-like protein
MAGIFKKLEDSSLKLRVIPFVVFVLPLGLQGPLGLGSPFWIYVLRTCAGAALVWWMWPRVKEMRWAFSWEAVVAGIAVFFLWIGLGDFVPKLLTAEGAGWNPHEVYGAGSGLAWFFVIVRLVGSSLVVPPMEEVFYRSFFYRYMVRSEFMGVELKHFDLRALVVTSLVFGFAHHEWLAGIVCGLIYQGLVLRKGRLGDAMTAHAITNFLLGAWVIYRGAWHFW